MLLRKFNLHGSGCLNYFLLFSNRSIENFDGKLNINAYSQKIQQNTITGYIGE
jgi:hypothetical protein